MYDLEEELLKEGNKIIAREISERMLFPNKFRKSDLKSDISHLNYQYSVCEEKLNRIKKELTEKRNELRKVK